MCLISSMRDMRSDNSINSGLNTCLYLINISSPTWRLHGRSGTDLRLQISPATRHGGAWGRGGIAPTHSWPRQ
jgi:hypothetical protein